MTREVLRLADHEIYALKKVKLPSLSDKDRQIVMLLLSLSDKARREMEAISRERVQEAVERFLFQQEQCLSEEAEIIAHERETNQHERSLLEAKIDELSTCLAVSNDWLEVRNEEIIHLRTQLKRAASFYLRQDPAGFEFLKELGLSNSESDV